MVEGHHVVAATASIPCKYQTVVTDNSDRLGFQAQAKRFQENAEIVSFCVLAQNSRSCMLNYLLHVLTT